MSKVPKDQFNFMRDMYADTSRSGNNGNNDGTFDRVVSDYKK